MRETAKRPARFQVASDQSLLVYFEVNTKEPGTPGAVRIKTAPPRQNQITAEAHQQVRRLLRLIELEPINGVRNLHPAYNSLLIKFDAVKLRHTELEEILRAYIARMEKIALPEARLVEVPVCYGGDLGPDLKSVAELHGLTSERVIELHAAATYVVYFLGFAPGFAYLGELAEELVTPRLGTPRKSVPAGSVGIAGSQTGVYPISTPGGWRLLGRTPLAMFRPDRAEMSLLSIGDRVQFVPISLEKFAALERA
ncbi:MAG TPA: 5-oxoprolinase subunit PxpB [Candidatus Acidoferrum sp.]|nr:5-oxoprolinase subunit PxpB [Candidatus Acidoferrum sp.]